MGFLIKEIAIIYFFGSILAVAMIGLLKILGFEIIPR
jgi:hypothetical protein|tara:strand:+ start:2841 stop:2951 length:111 start_codon:yes stop_codon:yes gene_type:complete